MPADTVAVDLAAAERHLVLKALNEWGGPAHGTGQLALLLGHESVVATHHDIQRLRGEIERQRALTSNERTTALLATELAFASSVLGAVGQWARFSATTTVTSSRPF